MVRFVVKNIMFHRYSTQFLHFFRENLTRVREAIKILLPNFYRKSRNLKIKQLKQIKNIEQAKKKSTKIGSHQHILFFILVPQR